MNGQKKRYIEAVWEGPENKSLCPRGVEVCLSPGSWQYSLT